MTLRILITGGGTGGHVSPALAVVQSVREMAVGKEWRPEFLYVGSPAGVEKRLAEDAGLRFVSVQSGKLRRSFTLRGYLSVKNIVDLFRLPVGVIQAFGHVLRFRPAVVLSTGGYVSVPAVIAASLRGVPVLAHEQTVQVGLANKIAARFATKVALSFEGALNELPPRARSKAIVTGNPVRRIIFQGDPQAAVRHCGFDRQDNSMPSVYVTGGAQGAHIINEAVREALPELVSVCRIMHQCGTQTADSTQDYDLLTTACEQLEPSLRRRYFVTQFVRDEIGDIIALADVIVGRSGAGTVAEVSALGKPAVYVPLVPTGGDEQTKNARRVEEIGGAVILKNADANGQTLCDILIPLLSDPGLREKMSQAALTLARPNAVTDLARELLNLAGVAEP